MSDINATRERVNAGLGSCAFEELDNVDGILTLRCEMGAAHDLMRALESECGFELCTLVTAVDNDEVTYPVAARFDLIWQFQSVAHKDRVRVRAWLAADEPGEAGYAAPTITDIWPGAAYNERECFDMFGIDFTGHEGLKRILMPEAYDHFPLRKEFPHGGIEPDRLYKAWDKQRREGAGAGGQA